MGIDKMDAEIRFTAAVYKLQTLVDGGIRLTLDMPETSIPLTWFSKQSDKWQKFMFDIDDKWRQFNREQRESNLQSMNCVEGSLKDLTTVTQGLVSEVREMRDDSKAFYESFHAHDIQAKEILAQVQKPAPKPRVKKSEPNGG